MPWKIFSGCIAKAFDLSFGAARVVVLSNGFVGLAVIRTGNQKSDGGWRDLLLAPTREAAIVEELAQDLAERYAELIASGATEMEVYRQTPVELSESEILDREPRRVERLRLKSI